MTTDLNYKSKTERERKRKREREREREKEKQKVSEIERFKDITRTHAVRTNNELREEGRND